MPGMMDTVLNLGLTADTIGALYRDFRSLQAVADVITNFVGSATPVFAGQRGTDAPAHPLIPETAGDQLIGAIEGVFASWNNDRARLYRQIHHIPGDYGTAAIVQAMVFGNADTRSGTGVLFTRDPVTGADEPRGEWVPAAQGEAIVSGRSTPVPVAMLASSHPDVYAELLRASQQLESAAGEPQDIEFTVEAGKLYFLQTRALKCTPLAACTITLALLDDGSITRREAVRRLSSLDITDLVTEIPRHPPHDSLTLAAGLAASPGIARGTAARELSPADARDAGRSVPWILIRPETSPHDLPAMRKAVALVTERGGLTSHAAIVARELRIPCVVGCGDLTMIRNGQKITVDGTAGRVYDGALETQSSVPDVVRRAHALLASNGK
jgi:pyruvate, orthophosphate dikinase